MVTIKSFKECTSKDGRSFIILELSGGVEMVQSQQTGKFYATVRKCFIPATFEADTAEALVGTKMEGEIVRVQSEPYDYTVQTTGEVITLQHTYSYQPTKNAVPVGHTQVSEMV
jgi:hypothetical protein